jgi:Tat protein secretion system quality control protein TatD with DNase activity
MLLPFDAHNHIHMGATPPIQALLSTSASGPSDRASVALSGLAIMSTHPKDFERVRDLSHDLKLHQPDDLKIVPCFGVHPWWVSELTQEDWQEDSARDALPRWLVEVEDMLVTYPHSIVGEIGLDGFHFDRATGGLKAPMAKQVEVFRLQMELAAKHQRPVSIHTVQCFGVLMDTLSIIKKSTVKLPPKMYFHAFGGKQGTIDQLLALCGREPGKVYFGFAPVINFRSPKTADVVRKVGLDRLVLESDHEDAQFVPKSIEDCVDFLASSLDVGEEEVIQQTTRNAFSFYGLD